MTPLARDANSVALVVPAGWKAGAFACRIVGEQESSGITVFHAPAAWWVQGDAGLEATAGGWLRVLGKCLDFNGRSRIALRVTGSEARVLEASERSMFSLKAELPTDLAAGAHAVWVHNGHGGPAGWHLA